MAVGICKKCIESNLTQSASVASSCWVAPPVVPAVGGPRQRSHVRVGWPPRLPVFRLSWVAPPAISAPPPPGLGTNHAYRLRSPVGGGWPRQRSPRQRLPCSCWVAPAIAGPSPELGGPRAISAPPPPGLGTNHAYRLRPPVRGGWPRQWLPCSCWVAPAIAGLSPELGGPPGDFSPSAAGPWHEPRLSHSITIRRWVAPASGSLVRIGWPPGLSPRLPVFRLSWVAPRAIPAAPPPGLGAYPADRLRPPVRVGWPRQWLPCSCWVAPAIARISPELGGPAGDFSPSAARPWHESRLSPSTTSPRWVAPASGSLVRVGWPPRLPVLLVGVGWPHQRVRHLLCLCWVAPASAANGGSPRVPKSNLASRAGQ